MFHTVSALKTQTLLHGSITPVLMFRTVSALKIQTLLHGSIPPVLMFHTVSVLKTKTLLHGSITIFASLKMKDIRLFVLLNHKHSFCIIHTVIGLWSNDICRLHHSNFTMKSYSRQNKYHDARAN